MQLTLLILSTRSDAFAQKQRSSCLVLDYFILIFAAISYFALSPVTGQGADTEFKSLFAADTLDGWETIGPAKWRVAKGELVTGQDGDPKRWGMLQTKLKYRDFELKLDFKIDEYGKYNSGVYLRQPTERGVGREFLQFAGARDEIERADAGDVQELSDDRYILYSLFQLRYFTYI